MIKIPALLNTFAKREVFLNTYFHFYNKHFGDKPEFPFYITIDNDEVIKQKNTNILLYENTPTSSHELHECVSRYYRHLYTMHYFKSQGFEYMMNLMDDGWIEYVNWEQLYKSIDYIKNNNADRIDICGPQLLYPLIKIDEHVSLINPNNTITWYVTNQCSIWKIDSLLKIYEELGPVTDWQVEMVGSDVARNLNCKFLTFNNPVIDNQGVNQRKVGLSNKGKKLLKEYCEGNNLDYNEEYNKFIKFI